MFQDGNIWANVGTDQIHTFQELQDQVMQKLDYQAIDLSKYDYEVYVYERPFYNQPYLHISLVIEHKTKKVFEYIRKDGAYWENLQVHYTGSKDLNTINGNEVYNPPMEVIIEGTVQEKTVYPLPLFGHQNPNRTAFDLEGGACPSKGGDMARYPWGNTGGGWPSNYQEITPLCNGIFIDIKCWANLFVETWNDPTLALGNAGFNDETLIHYRAGANLYGQYTDPYLVKNKKENPHMLDLTSDGNIVGKAARNHHEVLIPIEYNTKSNPNDFNEAPQVGLTKSASLQDYCPNTCPQASESKEPSCPAAEKQAVKLTNDKETILYDIVIKAVIGLGISLFGLL